MKFFKKSHIYVELLVIFAVIVEVFLVNVNQGYWWDEAVYLDLAKSIYNGFGYSINTGQESFRAPLFPLIVAGVWKFFGVNELVVKILPIIFSVLSIILTYVFAKELYNLKTALWSALFLFTTPMFLFFSLRILTETIFIFISLAAAYTYFLAIERKKPILFLVSGIAMALAFLTRYPGFILGIVYFLYPIVAKVKTKFWLKNYFFWFGVLLSFAILLPWLIFNLQALGSPVRALIREGATLTRQYYGGPWYFYATNWIAIFGLVGLMIFPEIWNAISNKKSGNSFVLLFLILVLTFFSLLARKEARYLLTYLPIFTTIFAYGATRAQKDIASSRVFTVAVLILVAMNFWSGLQMIYSGLWGGIALKDAGLYLSETAPQNSYILSQDYPVINYLSGRKVLGLPENASQLQKVARENVSYILIDANEPNYPDWVWNISNGQKIPSEIFDNFTLEKTFDEYGMTIVWVYRAD